MVSSSSSSQVSGGRKRQELELLLVAVVLYRMLCSGGCGFVLSGATHQSDAVRLVKRAGRAGIPTQAVPAVAELSGG
jgi:hypothetical protein